MDCAAVIVASLLSPLQGVGEAALAFLQRLGAERAANLLNLEKNADALAKEMRGLKDVGADLENRVRTREMRPGMRRTRQVSAWLQDVEALRREARGLEDSLTRRSSFLESCSIDSLRSGWVLGMRVAEMLKRVRELRSQSGGFEGQLVDEAPPPAAVAVPGGSGWIVGGEKTLAEIGGHLSDDKVGIIGIYGMGGVGKTTLLKEINNRFVGAGEDDFDVVIWVTVSRQLNVSRIQEDIGVRLGFPRRGDLGGFPLPENKDDRRNALYRALHEKRFLLLLDDMWEALDLGEVGIPLPANFRTSAGKKIVFTTRSEEVCADMDAHQSKVKVGFLGKEDSWELFCSKVDAKVGLDNTPDIHLLARRVVEKCGGLPLALNTVGRAMSNATRVGEWRQAVERLRGSPDGIRGMKDVLAMLRFSFDRLEDDATRGCLLYCALFPADHDIWIHCLVDYWVGEGFLDAHSGDTGSLGDARDRGDCIIRKLKNACLLESGTDADMHVKMHDVVREMALWVTREDHSVCDDEKNVARLVESSTWVNAKRVSVIQEDVFELPSLESKCPNLLTLLIRGEFVITHKQLVVPLNFFESMSSLRVLDLSGTNMEELPKAVGLLAELCHLNLSGTRIRQLPKELGKLVRLRQLNLHSTWDLRQIPREAILALTRLQTLDVYDSAYRWEDDDPCGIKLSDLECSLGHLEELSVCVGSWSCLEILANSKRLQKCTREVHLWDIVKCTSSLLSTAMGKLESLQCLDIEHCSALEVWSVDSYTRQLGRLKELRLLHLDQLKDVRVLSEALSIKGRGRRGQGGHSLHPPLFPFLQYLCIDSCRRLKDLRWVGQLPHLEWLYVRHCYALEELLAADRQGTGAAADEVDGNHGASFPMLKIMSLFYLPALRSISKTSLLFPSLEELWVEDCSQLKKLPFRCHGCKKIKKIQADQEWWDALEWDNYNGESIKSELTPFLRSHQAFSLKADDLKFLASQFRRLHCKQLQHTFRYYSHQWRTWAACFIQAAWRRYSRKKFDEYSSHQSKGRLQPLLDKADGKTPSHGATVYASNFAVNAVRNLRRNGIRKGWFSEEIVETAGLDFTIEEDLG